MKDLLDAMREAAPTRVWDQGVKLARDGRVAVLAREPSEIETRVKVPGLGVAPTVVLYPDDAEWDCDCPSPARVCSHAIAAALACADDAGPAQPTRRPPVIGYRLRVDGDLLAVAREVVDTDTARPIRALRDAPDALTTAADQTVESLLGTRPDRPVARDRLPALLGALASAASVHLGDDRVRCSDEPVRPRATVRDAGDGVELVIERDPEVTAAVAVGVARCGDVLRPLADTDLTGDRLEALPFRRRYAPAELGELVGTLLPELRARIDVAVDTARLPGINRVMRPRVALELRYEGDALSVLPTIVYGDPPVARVDGDRLVHLGGDAPARQLDAERALVHRLRDELDMVPGRRVTAGGDAAPLLAQRVRAWHGDLSDDARRLVEGPPLSAALTVDGDRVAVRFTSRDGREADPAQVLAAWRAGADLAPLIDGGWGSVPAGWLAHHADRVQSLLDARDAAGRVAPYVAPDVRALCDALGQPPPAELDRLRPLFESFDALPPAAPPEDLRAELRDYQRDGVRWLQFLRDAGLGGVLADDMGLGKTLQALCAVRGRTLVVCPTSVLPNWAAEAARFRPSLRVCVYHGPSRTLDDTAELVITSYALLRLDLDRLAERDWDVAILDEAQHIKNPDSQVARAAYRLRAGARFALTGTPIENRLDELWSQLSFCNPGLLGSRRSFDDRYGSRIAAGDADAAARLRARVRPFVLRRRKAEVAPELPPRTEAVLYCELDDTERAVYDAVRAAARADVVARLAEGGSVLAALELLLRLRQASCHAGLVPGQRADTSSKLAVLREVLDEVVAEGHKALVFSQWTSLLDRVEPELAAAGIAHLRLDGSTRDRAAVVDGFQRDDGPPVLLISLKAGGTGLNLTAADHVFLLDPWWNPAVEDQAADRAHRIGQDKPVSVYRLVARDTVEERVLALQARKRALADAALADGGAALAITRDDLLALLD